MADDPEFIAELEKAGEDVVRLRMEQKLYSAGRRVAVSNWLGKKDSKRNSASDEIARRAVAAAESQAKEARDANVTARIALCVAAIATVISLFALFGG